MKISQLSSYLLIAFFTLMAVMIIPGIAFAQEEVHVFIDGPSMLQTNATVEYNIKITGGPADGVDGNYTFTARVEDDDGEEIKEVVDPINGTSSSDTFKVNITAPENAQTITFIVDGGSSTNDTNIEWGGEVQQSIEVFHPIIANISATIRNTGSIIVDNAVVSFYVDDIYIGNKTGTIIPNGSREFYYNWITSKKEVGEHEVEVRVNDDGLLLEGSDDENVMRMTIYVGKRPAQPQGPIMIFNSDGMLFFLYLFGFFFGLGAIWTWQKTRLGRGYYGKNSTFFMFFIGILYMVLSFPIFTVSQILTDNPDIAGDAGGRLKDAIFIFIIGFVILFFTLDRSRKKKR